MNRDSILRSWSFRINI